MAMNKSKLVDVLEISSLVVDGDRWSSAFVDSGLLMYLAQYNTYGSIDDCLSDGEKPRKVKLQLHVYIEELEFTEEEQDLIDRHELREMIV